MKKATKIISILVILFLVMFLTIGFPQNIVESTWYSVWCIKGWQGIVAALISLAIIAFFVAQWINEWKMGGNANESNL